MLSEISWVEGGSTDSYAYGTPMKITLTIGIIMTLAMGALIQHRLRIFLKRKSGRPVNRLIQFHCFIQNVTIPPALFYTLLNAWVEIPSQYLPSAYCCHLFIFDMVLVLTFIQSFSLFMSLYRYMCIVQGDFMARHNISPKV